MNFKINENQKMIADMIQQFGKINITPFVREWDEKQIFPVKVFKKLGELGLMGVLVPTEYSGSGFSYNEYVTAIEQLAILDPSIALSMAAHNSLCTGHILQFGNEKQKKKWLPKLSTGEYVASLAMTEPSTGSDVQAIKTTAEKDGNQYRINGSKIFITNGGSADLIVLAAKTNKNEKSKGVSLVVVETKDLEGFSRGKPLKKLGQKGNDTCELFFEDVKVPLTNLLGSEEGQGFYQLMKQLPWERLAIGIGALGNIDFALEETIKYVKDRKAFDKRIMDFQNTRFQLAEMKTKAEVLRSFINDCVDRVKQGSLDAATASMAKYWGSQTQNEIMDGCLQLHGGYGFIMEYPIARMYADARVQSIYGGTNEIMKELIARSLDD